MTPELVQQTLRVHALAIAELQRENAELRRLLAAQRLDIAEAADAELDELSTGLRSELATLGRDLVELNRRLAELSPRSPFSPGQ